MPSSAPVQSGEDLVLQLRMLESDIRAQTNCPELAEELAVLFAAYRVAKVSSDAATIQMLHREGGWELRTGERSAFVSDLRGWPGADYFILSSLFHARRDLLFLHASCVRGPYGAVLFVGASNCGKSTLAAGLDGDGWPLLCDDITPVRLDTAQVLPFVLRDASVGRRCEVPVSDVFFFDAPIGTLQELPTLARWHAMLSLCGDGATDDEGVIRMQVRSKEDFARVPQLRGCRKSEAMRLLMRHVFPPRSPAIAVFAPLARFSTEVRFHHLHTGHFEPTLSLVRAAVETRQ